MENQSQGWHPGVRTTRLRSTLAVGCLGLALLWAGSGSASSQAAASGEPVSRVRASGEATVAEQPDQVWLELAVVSLEPDASAAVRDNADMSQKLEARIQKELGPDGEIVSSGYTLSPSYSYVQGQGQKLDGFQVRNRLRVTLADVSAAGRVIDAASQAGATEIQQVRFSLSDEGPARKRALEAATKNALARATAMAEALDLRVLRVISVADQRAASAPVMKDRGLLAQSDGNAGAPTSIRSGAVTIHAGVTVEVAVGR